MAAQSFAMGHAFGTSFQYGKRKISSMTNEEFNNLDSVALHASLQADIRAMIPSMNQSFDRMEQFQIDIINSMIDTIKLGIKEFGSFITGGGSTSTETSTSAIDYGVSDVAYSGSLGLPAGILAGLKPGTKQFADVAKKLYEDAQKILKFKQTPRAVVITPPKKSYTPAATLRITTKAITKSGASGAVFKISSAIAEMKFRLQTISKLKNKPNQRALSFANQKSFLVTAKKYNQFVLSNPKYGRKYRVNTAQSIKASRLIFG